MPSRIVDEEAGMATVKECAVQVEGCNSMPATPTTPTTLGSPRSTDTYVENRFSTCSDRKLAACCHEPGVWSRRMGSILASLGVRRTSSSTESKKQVDFEAEKKVRKTEVRAIHEQPQGYPRMATFLDSDENFMIYRRFGYLGSRLLLEKQDELRLLEEKLDIIEEEEKEERPDGLTTRRHMSKARKTTLEEIEEKWTSYCQLLQHASSMTAFNKPTTVEQQSVARWMWKTSRPLDQDEMTFIQCKEDLVTLRPGREYAWLDSSIEKMLQNCKWPSLQGAFKSENTRRKSDGEDGTDLYTRSRIENFVVSIITVVILALLIAPIGLLYNFSEDGIDPKKQSFECIGVLLVSTLAFSACISLFTRAKRHEILAASAGYCAVLVVFIGNLGQRA